MKQQGVFEFKLEGTGEEITAHSGLALMAEYNHGIGLRELVSKHLRGPRSNRGIKPEVYVNLLLLLLQGGGRTLEDMRQLKQDTGLMKLIGETTIPTSDAIGNWLRRTGEEEEGAGLDKVARQIITRIMRREEEKEYTLDSDATAVSAEKAEAKRMYTGEKGYMPMVGFLAEKGLCIYDEFREGNESPSSDQREFYEACKARMPKGRRIARYRADSASYQAEVINALGKDTVEWTITAAQDVAVRETIKAIPHEAWHRPEEHSDYEIAETVHCMNGTKEAFRLTVKRIVIRQPEFWEEHHSPYKYHAIATNIDVEKMSAFAVLQWHNQRGQAENFNKEVKAGFGLERMPCGQFGANAVFFRIGILAYNLFIGFKRLSCPPSWHHHTISTFRWRLIQIAGRIIRHARQIILRVVTDPETLAVLRYIRKKTWQWECCGSG